MKKGILVPLTLRQAELLYAILDQTISNSDDQTSLNVAVSQIGKRLSKAAGFRWLHPNHERSKKPKRTP